MRTVGGDILIRAASNITIDGEVNAQSGDIGLLAQGNFKQNANVTTLAGDILISVNGSIDMGSASSTSSARQLILSSQNGSITIGLLDANHIAVTAQSDILDGNGADALNVIAEELSLRSISGSIGRPAPPASDRANPNAIDTRVGTLAGQAANGIYLQESDDLTIDHVQSLTVAIDNIQQVHFRSSPTSLVTASQAIAALDDLKSSTEIKLFALNGSIVIEDGLNADGVGIRSLTAGSILLQASNNGALTNGDIRSNTAILSEGGHISLIAARNLVLSDDVVTKFDGAIFAHATNGFVRIADSADGDLDGVRTSSGDILILANGEVQVDANIQSESGSIGIIAGDSIYQNADLLTQKSGSILLNSGGNLMMRPDVVTSAFANYLAIAAGNAIMGQVSAATSGTSQIGNETSISVSIAAEQVTLDDRGPRINPVSRAVEAIADGVERIGNDVGNIAVVAGNTLSVTRSIQTEGNVYLRGGVIDDLDAASISAHKLVVNSAALCICMISLSTCWLAGPYGMKQSLEMHGKFSTVKRNPVQPN